MQMFENQESEVQIKLCRNASILAKLVSILLTLALAIHIAAMSTSYWLVSYTENGKDLDIHTGIWVSCAKSEDIIWICDSFEQYPGFNAWFYVTQTFAVFGILVLIPNILISVLYTLLPKLSGRKFAAILTIVLSLCAGK
ncbi:hypothetical protein SNE40_021694 [Patella caerulea]|uniref:Uncharacterized protein n=1 Tax=Patella caerulea TaxID=87958 RepID=A0AAN8IY09_PATCE